ncbi:MAG: TetR/AcrR family transcriptional regulator [Eggerthellaceae bacterium]|nr:TetR/AcrR family transcriptional regulator [Eggerthellaceae bacterium]
MPIERNPRDSRLRYTKDCLYQSFLAFLEEKPVSDITVIEICERAGVSRKTFYKYYSDQFALLRGMQEDLFEDYRERIADLPADVFAVTPELIRFTDENRVLMKAVFANRGEGNFVDRALDDLYATYATAWQKANPKLSKQQVESLFYYVVSGLFGLVRHWLFDQSSKGADEVIADAEYLMKLSTP